MHPNQRVARDPKWSEKLREERERGERQRELRQSAAAALPRHAPLAGSGGVEVHPASIMQRCAVCITGKSFDCGTHQASASCLCRPEKLALVALVGSSSAPRSKVRVHLDRGWGFPWARVRVFGGWGLCVRRGHMRTSPQHEQRLNLAAAALRIPGPAKDSKP